MSKDTKHKKEAHTKVPTVKRPERFSHIQGEIRNDRMRQLTIPGETLVVAQMYDVGHTQPFRHAGKTNRSFLFEWNRATGCHEIVVPAGLWELDNGAMARELSEQKLKFPICFRIRRATTVKELKAKHDEAVEAREAKVKAKAAAQNPPAPKSGKRLPQDQTDITSETLKPQEPPKDQVPPVEDPPQTADPDEIDGQEEQSTPPEA